MANDLNQCLFIGRLGADPETRHTPQGNKVVNIRIAVGWKGRDSEGTEWVPVVFFGKLADIADQYLRKGSQIYVSGRFKTRSWEKDGVTHYRTEIIASEMQMLSGSKPDQESGSHSGSGYGRSAGAQSNNSQRNSTSSGDYARATRGSGTTPPAPAGGGHSADPGFGEDDIPFSQVDWRGA